MYLVRLPFFIRWFYPKAIWRVRTREKVAYLTFDDGPIPKVTPWVLDVLAKEKVKATFFCVGENVHKHPDEYQRILSEGHKVGNHTYNHLQAFKEAPQTYLQNIAKAQRLVESKLFRPPHGQLSFTLSRAIQKQFTIIFWDILSCDFDANKTPEQCYSIVKSRIRPGSLIVFHDSLKAEKNLRYALPHVIKDLKSKGYRFDVVPERN